MVDWNLYALVISGEADLNTLHEAWTEIMNQFSLMISNNEYKMYLSLYKELATMNITLDQIECIVGVGDSEKGIPPGILRIVYSKFFHDELNILLNTKCVLNWSDGKSYTAELDKCLRRTSGLRMRRDLKKLQFEAIRTKNEKNSKGSKPATREYFTSVLISLSDFVKYQIYDTISVYEYCERIKRLNDYHDKLNQSK